MRWLANGRDVEFVTDVNIDKANWIEKAGTGIAKSRFLHEIHVYIDFNDIDDDWLHEVCDAISRNRSIEEFALSMIDDRSSVMDERRHRPIDVDIFNVLAPFFEQNDKIRRIDIIGVTSKEYNSLSSMLSRNKLEHLERVVVRNMSVGDREHIAFFDSLREVKNLSGLGFDTNPYSSGCKELANLLEHPSSNIRSLEVLIQFFDDEDFTILSNAFTKKNNLTELMMWGQGSQLTSGGWRSFSAVLSQPDCSLEKLRLNDSFSTYDNTDDEAISSLGAALAVNMTLKDLCLDRIRTITTAGWRGLLNCLRFPHSALESLSLQFCEIDDEAAVAAIMALAENSTLKMLIMTSRPFRLSGSVVARVLYDKTSINSTFASNHTLTVFWGPTKDEDISDDIISSCLKMNRNVNKSEVAREKILKHHFPRGGAGIQTFFSMPETALPNAIEWIGRDRHGYSLMYDLARGLPTLFDNPRELLAGAKKRKR